MSRASHYRAQAELRPLRPPTGGTVQPNLERELRSVSKELDDLANEIADDSDSLCSEMLEARD
jgi:hypothetical protein